MNLLDIYLIKLNFIYLVISILLTMSSFDIDTDEFTPPKI